MCHWVSHANPRGSVYQDTYATAGWSKSTKVLAFSSRLVAFSQAWTRSEATAEADCTLMMMMIRMMICLQTVTIITWHMKLWVNTVGTFLWHSVVTPWLFTAFSALILCYHLINLVSFCFCVTKKPNVYCMRIWQVILYGELQFMFVLQLAFCIIIIIIIIRHAPCQCVAPLATNSLHGDLSKASSIASSKVRLCRDRSLFKVAIQEV